MGLFPSTIRISRPRTGVKKLISQRLDRMQVFSTVKICDVLAAKKDLVLFHLVWVDVI